MAEVAFVDGIEVGKHQYADCAYRCHCAVFLVLKQVETPYAYCAETQEKVDERTHAVFSDKRQVQLLHGTTYLGILEAGLRYDFVVIALIGELLGNHLRCALLGHFVVAFTEYSGIEHA